MALSLQHSAALMSMSNKRQAEVMALPHLKLSSSAFLLWVCLSFIAIMGIPPDKTTMAMEYTVKSHLLAFVLPAMLMCVFITWIITHNPFTICACYMRMRARLFFKVPSASVIYGSASQVTCLVYSLVCFAVVCTSLQVSCCECSASWNSFQRNFFFFRGHFSRSLFCFHLCLNGPECLFTLQIVS